MTVFTYPSGVVNADSNSIILRSGAYYLRVLERNYDYFYFLLVNSVTPLTEEIDAEIARIKAEKAKRKGGQ